MPILFFKNSKIITVITVMLLLFTVISCDNQQTKVDKANNMPNKTEDHGFLEGLKKTKKLAQEGSYLAKDELFNLYTNINFIGFNPEEAYKVYLNTFNELEVAVNKGDVASKVLLADYYINAKNKPIIKPFLVEDFSEGLINKKFMLEINMLEPKNKFTSDDEKNAKDLHLKSAANLLISAGAEDRKAQALICEIVAGDEFGSDELKKSNKSIYSANFKEHFFEAPTLIKEVPGGLSYCLKVAYKDMHNSTNQHDQNIFTILRNIYSAPGDTKLLIDDQLSWFADAVVDARDQEYRKLLVVNPSNEVTKQASSLEDQIKLLAFYKGEIVKSNQTYLHNEMNSLIVKILKNSNLPQYMMAAENALGIYTDMVVQAINNKDKETLKMIEDSYQEFIKKSKKDGHIYSVTDEFLKQIPRTTPYSNFLNHAQKIHKDKLKLERRLNYFK